MKVVKEENVAQEGKAIAFDPSKAYTWNNTATFTLNGAEFGLILNALRGVLSTPEAQRLFLAMRANDIVEEQLAKAVANGTAVEKQEENN